MHPLDILQSAKNIVPSKLCGFSITTILSSCYDTGICIIRNFDLSMAY